MTAVTPPGGQLMVWLHWLERQKTTLHFAVLPRKGKINISFMKITDTSYILAVNAGSSSIKLAVFSAPDTQKVLEVAVENIGQQAARLVTEGEATPLAAGDHSEAAAQLIDWLKPRLANRRVVAVGHRIVHGGPAFYETQPATPDTLAALHKLSAFSPEHLPVELRLVHDMQTALPEARQILCFDTAFHHDLPARAQLLPVPRRFTQQGVRRYGFHGLSYAYIVEELRRVEGQAAAAGKVVIAHLGSGVSLAALQGGRSIDTTMSMTPASGVPMSTRSGDLDPGLMAYLAETQGYTPAQLRHMANFESGLLGMSGTTADMKQLLETAGSDPHAKEAVDVFCYNITKTVGAFAAALGGLHTLVFTGGMGENAPKIRSQVCQGLEFLGVILDDGRNQAGERLISQDGSGVGVHVIHTDEATTIARETINLLNKKEE